MIQLPDLRFIDLVKLTYLQKEASGVLSWQQGYAPDFMKVVRPEKSTSDFMECIRLGETGAIKLGLAFFLARTININYREYSLAFDTLLKLKRPPNRPSAVMGLQLLEGRARKLSNLLDYGVP